MARVAKVEEVISKVAALKAADLAGRTLAADGSIEWAKYAGALLARQEMEKEALSLAPVRALLGRAGGAVRGAKGSVNKALRRGIHAPTPLQGGAVHAAPSGDAVSQIRGEVAKAHPSIKPGPVAAPGAAPSLTELRQAQLGKPGPQLKPRTQFSFHEGAQVPSVAPTSGTLAAGPAAPAAAPAAAGKGSKGPAAKAPAAAAGPAEAATEAAKEKPKKLISTGTKAKMLGYGALGLGGYGLYKGVPWAARQLEQGSGASMAYGGGWSPVSYGYGYNPYGSVAPGPTI